MFLLVPAHPVCPGQNQESSKTVCVCVCVCVCVSQYNYHDNTKGYKELSVSFCL